MSLLTKIRRALNDQARAGESADVKRAVAPYGEPEAFTVQLRCLRHGLVPPMLRSLERESRLSAAQCRVVQGGLPAVALLLWNGLREHPAHPDHPGSVYQLTRVAAEATGLTPEEVGAELLAALEEERDAAVATLRLSKGGDLPDTGKSFTVPAPPVAERPAAAPQYAGLPPPGDPVKLSRQLKKAKTPQERSMIFRVALMGSPYRSTPAILARACEVSEATVTKVLQWKAVGGVKVRRVQDKVALLLCEPVDEIFPVRGPAIAGGGFKAQRRNWV